MEERLKDYIEDLKWDLNNENKEMLKYMYTDGQDLGLSKNVVVARFNYHKGQVETLSGIIEVLEDIVRGR